VFTGRLIAILVGVLVLAGGVTAIVIAANKSGPPAAAPTSTSQTPPPASTSSSAPQSTTTTLPPPVQSNGVVDYQNAGQLVINYYNATPNVDAMWGMISPQLQQGFGDVNAFKQYWAQFPDVSARNARGVTANPDGSVNVPVDVTYKDGQTQHKVVKVIAQGTTLLIATDGR
jgi:hypothetical protein